MCQWCVAHGDGKIWYKNAKNYARKMYKVRKEAASSRPEVSPQTQAELIIEEVIEARDAKPEEYPKLKKNVERMLHTVHFGQVLPLQDIKDVMDIAYPIAKMTCACRRRVRGLRDEENFYCMGLGVGMYKWERWPELYRGGVEFMSPEEAKKWLEDMNKLGTVHTVWTFGTPYIGGVCNCEYPVCLGIRNRLDYDIQILVKGEYAAKIDYRKCDGCGACVKRCQFGAAKMEISLDKANIDMFKCFGCGLCETACQKKAVTLVSRSSIPMLRNIW